jgi:hypothetical protein
VISVIIPTIAGREEHYERCRNAFESRSVLPIEIITEYEHPTCGLAWQAGAERAKGDYLHFLCDDLEPAEGWDTAAVGVVEQGAIPAPRVIDARTGELQCRPQWGQETPDGTDTGISVIPFLSRAQWEAVQPLFTGHYFCVVPETLVLKSSMEWVAAGKLDLGDDLVGVDEFPEPFNDRKFRHAVVTGNSRRGVTRRATGRRILTG